MPAKCISNMQESCLEIAITHGIVISLKITKNLNSDHQMGQSHLLGKNTFKPKRNAILLNIENIYACYHFHQYFKILTNLLNLITHLTISSLNICKKKNSDHQIQRFPLLQHFFFTPTHKPIYHPLCII
jgi:hypothetical protein